MRLRGKLCDTVAKGFPGGWRAVSFLLKAEQPSLFSGLLLDMIRAPRASSLRYE